MHPKVAQHFDQLSSRYDNFFTRWAGECELQQIRHLIPDQSTVLDFGCGTGRTTIDLLQRGCNVTAYDFSMSMVALARKKAKLRKFTAEFIDNPQLLTNRTWPFITCIGVSDYYPDPVQLLQVLRRYLSANGQIVITYPNASGIFGVLYSLASRLSMPVYPQSTKIVHNAAKVTKLLIDDIRFAFPSWKPLSMTVVFSLKLSH